MRGRGPLLLAAVAGLAIGGCQTAQIAKKVEFVGLSSELKAGQRQPVKAESCGIKVFGIGPVPNMKDALAKVDVRYITKMEIDRDFKNYVVFTKDCWFVHGEGFK